MTTTPAYLRPIPANISPIVALCQEAQYLVGIAETTTTRLYELLAELDAANRTSPTTYCDILIAQAAAAIARRINH